MEIIGILLFVFIGCTSGTEPVPIAAPAIRTPADACWSRSGVCVATVVFKVLSDGSVSDVSIKESSRDRACDVAVKHGVAKWRYASRTSPIKVIKQVQGYTCPAH